MAYRMDADGERRLEGYFDGIGELLGSSHRRESFAMYAMGLLSESERKSMEPIAARATGDPEHAGAGHQRIHHFISNTSWDDHEVRLSAARAQSPSSACRMNVLQLQNFQNPMTRGILRRVKSSRSR